MTLPAATFTSVAPPADGLVLAFTSARRRRNSKAAVSAFGGAVAIASALSFLAPPGQTLVQEPAQPAHGGLLPGLDDAPRHGAAPALLGTAATRSQTPPTGATGRPGMARSVTIARRSGQATSATVGQPSCGSSHMLACAVVHPPADGAPKVQASVCPSAASVTVDYSPPTVGPSRATTSHTVAVGGSCGGS